MLPLVRQPTCIPSMESRHSLKEEGRGLLVMLTRICLRWQEARKYPISCRVKHENTHELGMAEDGNLHGNYQDPRFT